MGGVFEPEFFGGELHLVLVEVDFRVDVVGSEVGRDGIAFFFEGLNGFAEGLGEVFDDGAGDGFGDDVVGLIVGLLKGAPVVGDFEGAVDGFCPLIGIHDDAPGCVAGGASAGLDEGGFAAKKAFFIGIEDGDEGDFGNVESFAKKVDADEDIECPAPKFVDDLNALEGVDIGVEIFGFDADFGEVFGEIFGEFFGEGGDENAPSFFESVCGFLRGNRRLG